MSNIPPQPKVDQIVWFETHIPLWQAAPTTFGVTAAMITNLHTAVKAARAAYDAAQGARQAAKSATTTQDMQVKAMLTQGRDTVNIMKSFLENANNPALWGEAGLEPNATPGTAPAPTAPYELFATLDSQGNVIVKWKASQPVGVSGVIYSVRRSINGASSVLLDSVGGKEFIDETVPIGTRTVSYAVKAKRGTSMSGWSESLTIMFGRVGGGGGIMIASTETTPASGKDGAMKMAA